MRPPQEKIRDATVENDQIVKLLELAREIAAIDLATLDVQTREKIREMQADVDLFLWKVALRETADAKIAAASVDRAVTKLHDGSMWRFPGAPFRRWASGDTWRGQSPRFWLFNQAKGTTQELKADPKKLKSARSRLPPANARITDEASALLKSLAILHCSLKRSRQTRGEWREGDCTGGCDILFLYRQEFSISEINQGVNLPRAVVFDYVARCEELEAELAETKSSGPAPPPPSSGSPGGHANRALKSVQGERTARAESLLRGMITSYLTEDELQWRWTRLQNARSAIRRRTFFSNLGASLGQLFSSERRNTSLFGIAFATAAIVLALVIMRPDTVPMGTISLDAIPDPERAGNVTLPKTMRLNLDKARIELVEGDDLLQGTVEQLSGESSPGLSVFSAALEGKDSAGGVGRFRGKLWLTNSPGTSAIKKKSDLKGARLTGVFEIVGQSTTSLEQPYRP